MTEAPAPPSRGIPVSTAFEVALCLAFPFVLIALEVVALDAISEPGARHAGWLWRLLVPIGVLGAALSLPKRGRWLVLGITGSLCAAIVAGDLAYHGFFGTVTSAFMISSATQLADVDASVHALLSLGSLMPIAIFIPYLILAVWPSNAGRECDAHGAAPWPVLPARRVGAGLLVVESILILLAINVPIFEPTHHVGRTPWVRPSEHWGSRYSRLTHAATFGLFNYHLADLRSWIAEGLVESPIDEAARADVAATLAHKKRLNDESSPLFGIARGRHVVLLQLESLQHFLLDLEVSGHEVMPNLDGLARGGLRWDFILDVTHVGRTSDAEFAVMTGLYPDVRKPIAAYQIPAGMPTLPKSLAAAGYRSASIHGFKRSFWNRDYTHPAYGIDEMHFDEAFDESDRIGLGPSDRQVFRFAAEHLAARRETPQFLFVISLTSHHPYLAIPTEWVRPYARLDPNEGYGLLAPYLGSASYTDAAIGDFVERLASLGVLEDCLIVIYGDHDRGGLGETRPIPEVGPRMFGPGEDRVPLVILVPGEEERIAEHAARYRNGMGGLVDLFPTVLHLLGERVPKGVVGTHLFVENERRDPLPLPGPPGHFGHRGVLALGNGKTLRSQGAGSEVVPLPDPETALHDRLVTERLLDHHDELMSALSEIAVAKRP